MDHRFRTLIVASTLATTVAAPGCGSDQGGEQGATQEQMRDPAWVQSRLKELDKDPAVKTGKPKTGRASR